MSGATPHVSVTPAKAWAILGAMGLGALIAQMFSTVIGPALPTIKDDLDLSLSLQTWTVTSYSLAFGAALLAGGRLGDLIGEVKLIVIGFAVFGVGLFVALAAVDGLMLVAGRLVQGVGIGLSAPATLSIVVHTFPATRRGFAVGLWGFAHGFGLLIGPLLAGYALELLSWRWIFGLAVPLTIGVIIVTLAATRGYTSTLSKGTYDVRGLVVGAVGITLATLGLQNSSEGWQMLLTWGPLVAGALLLALFGYIELRSPYPLVDFSLWRNRIFSGSFFAQSAVGFVYIPMLVFVGSLYFINVLGYTPIEAGWIIVITTGTCMVSEPIGGRLVDRFGPGMPTVGALLMVSAALVWMSTFTPETTLLQVIAPLALMGIGVGIALPVTNTAAVSSVKQDQMGMGSGVIQMTFNLPAALGVALATSVIGTFSIGRVTSTLSGQPFAEAGAAYTQALESGDEQGAAAILSGLPADAAQLIQSAAIDAESATIALSMLVMGIIALGAAIMAAVVIGRRTCANSEPAAGANQDMR